MIISRVIIEIDPKIALKKIKILASLMDGIEKSELKGEFILIFKSIYEYIRDRSQNENVSMKILKDLSIKVEGLVTKEPLILIYSSLELFTTLSALRNDYSSLVSLFMKCLVFL